MRDTPLLLLPGMMCDARVFAPQIEALGGGRDVRVGDIGRHDSMAAIAAGLLDELPWRRFAVAGLSMGGIVAMAMLARAPERIERVALLDSNHRAEPPERRPVRDRQIAASEAGGLRAVIVDEMKPHYLARRGRRNAKLLDTLVAMAEALGPTVFARQSRALRDRPDYGGPLSAYGGPMLVLCGAEDRLCPPERHREIAALRAGAALVVVPEAGHISTLEQPAAVTAALRDWLAP